MLLLWTWYNDTVLVNPKMTREQHQDIISTCLSLLLWSKRCFTYEWVRLTNTHLGRVCRSELLGFIKWITWILAWETPSSKKLHEKKSLQRQRRKTSFNLPYLEVQWGKSSTLGKRSSWRDPTYDMNSTDTLSIFEWELAVEPSVSANSSSNFLGKKQQESPYPQANRTSATSARYGCQDNLSWRSDFQVQLNLIFQDESHLSHINGKHSWMIFGDVVKKPRLGWFPQNSWKWSFMEISRKSSFVLPYVKVQSSSWSLLL